MRSLIIWMILLSVLSYWAINSFVGRSNASKIPYSNFRINAHNKPLGDTIDMERIARGTPGFSGTGLESLLNEAALLAARRGKQAIERDDIEEAGDKILMGLERENLGLTEDECSLLAYHEAGHPVVAALLPSADPIHKVPIVPRGRAMGITQQLPERDKYVYPREYLLDRLVVMMGGRAADELVLYTKTSGAENNLKQATQLVRKMVLDWGMSEHIRQLGFGGRRQQVFLGEEIAHRRDYCESTAREVDQEIMKILDESYTRAIGILKERRKDLDKLADLLLEKEEVSGEGVIELLGLKTDLQQVAESDKLGCREKTPMEGDDST